MHADDAVGDGRDGRVVPVGSSHSRILGFLATARAMATRCCSPPESWAGKLAMRSARPTLASTSSGSEAPRTIWLASSTFSLAVRLETRL